MVKLAGTYAEKAKIAARNVRRDGMEALKTAEKKGQDQPGTNRSALRPMCRRSPTRR